MNCIRHHPADAVTADGVHRDICVSNDDLLDVLPASEQPKQIMSTEYLELGPEAADQPRVQ